MNTTLLLIVAGVAAIGLTAVTPIPAIAAGGFAALCIAAFAVYHGLSLQHKLKIVAFHIKSELHNIREPLPGQKVDNDAIRDARSLFEQGLVTIPGQKIKYSRFPAEESFNRRSVVDKQIEMSFYQSIPNLLIGVGILFTFMGIVVVLYTASRGVGDLAGSDVGAAKTALQNLFAALSVKFITSIFGIAGSALFNQFEKTQIHQVEQGIHDLCDRLNREHPPLRFEEELLNGIRAIDTTRSSEAITVAAGALQVASEKIGSQIEAIATTQSQMTPEALGNQIASVIDTRFTPVFEAIQKELSSLSAIKQDQGQEIVRNLMDALRTEVIQPVTERIDASTRQTQEVTEVVRDLQVTLATSLVETVNKLATTTETIREFQTDTMQRLQDFAAHLTAILDTFRDDTGAIMRSVASEIQAAIAESLKQLSEHNESHRAMLQAITREITAVFQQEVQAQVDTLRNVSEHFTQLVDRMKESVEAAVLAFQESMAANVQVLGTQRDLFEQSAHQASATFRGIREDLKEALSHQAQLEEDRIEKVQQRMMAQGEVFEQSMALAEQSFRELARNTIAMLAEQTTAQEKMLEKVQTDLSLAVNTAREGIQDTARAVQEATRSSIEGMQAQRSLFEESAQQASATFRGIREDLKEALSHQAQLEEERLERVQDRLKSMVEGVETSFSTQTQTLRQVGDEASELLVRSRDALLDGMRDVHSTLATTSEVVRVELQSFREQYQAALQAFFQEQNNLLDGTLGEQRRGLEGVVHEMQAAFKQGTELHVTAQAGFQETYGMVIDMQKNTARLATALGLEDASRLHQIEEIARLSGRTATEVSHHYGTLVVQVQGILDRLQEGIQDYLRQMDERQDRYFKEYDHSVAAVADRLVLAADVLAESTKLK